MTRKTPSKSGATEPYVVQTTVVAALIYANCDRPMAAFKELETVAREQLVQLVVDHGESIKKLASLLRKLCFRKRVALTRGSAVDSRGTPGVLGCRECQGTRPVDGLTFECAKCKQRLCEWCLFRHFWQCTPPTRTGHKAQ